MEHERLENKESESFLDDLVKEFLEKVNAGQIDSGVIDGLDGSGKGETAKSLAELYSERGINVLIVDFPQYGAKHGKLLKKMLNTNKEFTLKQRMAVYALNRLESLFEIMSAALDLGSQGKKVKIIFDRFSTSNFITGAYFYHNELFTTLEIDELNKVLAQDSIEGIDIKMMIEMMLEVDQVFHELLGIDPSKVKVYVPQINAEESMNRLNNDLTRDGADNYEKLPIQLLADRIYLEASKLEGFNIIIDPQNGGSPSRIARNAYEKFRTRKGQERVDSIHKGRIRKLLVVGNNEIQQVNEEMQRLESIFPYDLESYLES